MHLWTGKLYLKIPLQFDNSRNQMTTRDTELLRRPCLVSTLKRAMFTALESSCLSSWLAGKHLTGEQRDHCAATYPVERWDGEFALNDNCCLKLLQISAKVPAIISPVGYSAAARHRLARPDGWSSTGGAVPCEIALPVCRRNRSLCPGKSSQLSCYFPLQTFVQCCRLINLQLQQPEPEFRPPMSEVVQSLVRLVQRSCMGAGLSSERNSCRFDECGDHTF